MTAALGNTSQGTPFATGVDAFVYPQFIGYALRAPTVNDVYNAGTRWQNNSVNPPLIYETTGAGLWYIVAGSSVISSILGTANEITASTVSGVTTLSVPSTFVAPGSIRSTTTVTAGTGITSTTGNVTLSASGAGIVTNPVTGSGAASGTVTCNGRAGAVTFTGVSIAAGATLSLVMGNTSVTGASTEIIYTLSGATTGAAVSIQSVTNSASTSTIVVTNGTGATTQTGNITFTFIVLN